MTTPTPGRFRKNPVEIEAKQLRVDDLPNESAVEVARWCGGTAAADSKLSDATWRVYIETLEGTMTASPGDWVIRGVQGEFYPCKPDIFAETYSAVTPDDDTDGDRTFAEHATLNVEIEHVDVGVQPIRITLDYDHALSAVAALRKVSADGYLMQLYALMIGADDEDDEASPGHETGDMRADRSCTHCRGTGYIHTDDGVDDCRCTDGPDCTDCGAPDGGQHDRTCKHGADQ